MSCTTPLTRRSGRRTAGNESEDLPECKIAPASFGPDRKEPRRYPLPPSAQRRRPHTEQGPRQETGAATRDWGRTRGWNCKRDRGRHRREGRIMRCGPHSGKRPRQVSLQRQTGQCKNAVGCPRESGSARTGICHRSETRPLHLSHPTRHILRRQSAPEDFCFRARPPRPRRKTSTTTERT